MGLHFLDWGSSFLFNFIILVIPSIVIMVGRYDYIVYAHDLVQSRSHLRGTCILRWANSRLIYERLHGMRLGYDHTRAENCDCDTE